MRLTKLIAEDTLNEDAPYRCPKCGAIGELGFSSYWCSNQKCANYNPRIFPKIDHDYVTVKANFNANDVEEFFSITKGHRGVIVSYAKSRIRSGWSIDVIIMFDDHDAANEFTTDPEWLITNITTTHPCPINGSKDGFEGALAAEYIARFNDHKIEEQFKDDIMR